MTISRCWKCKCEGSEGKVSESGFFTCFTCLREWCEFNKPFWKLEQERARQESLKKPMNQMDIFEVAETLQETFHHAN